MLQENIPLIEYTGGLPFDILKPVLEKANPDQLNNLEYFNPYLMEESDSLWEPHVKKRFRTKQREDMESWREMYIVSGILQCYFAQILTIFLLSALYNGGREQVQIADRQYQKIEGKNGKQCEKIENSLCGFCGKGPSQRDQQTNQIWNKKFTGHQSGSACGQFINELPECG